MLLLLIWGLSLLFGLLGFSKRSENTRVALALAQVVGFFLFCGFISMPEPRIFRHAKRKAEMQEVSIERNEVSIERNKVRIGMTINEVLSLVRGMDIDASADPAWLSVLPDIKRFNYSPHPIYARQNDDGTFTFWCYCGSAQVSRNSPVTESQAAALMMRYMEEPEQVLKNLTEFEAAELMKRHMSDGFDWSWHYKTFKAGREYGFTVNFGRDGQVHYISDVYHTDYQNHRSQ